MRKHAIFTLVALTAALALAQTPEMTIKEGSPAPNFRMIDALGKVYTNDSLRGKAVLIDFWATWCGPCKKASPTVQMLHEKYAKKGLVVLGANTWERENKDTAAGDYAKEHKYTYTMTINNDELAKAWGVRGIPTFVILNRKGGISKIQIGFGGDETAKLLEEAVVNAMK